VIGDAEWDKTGKPCAQEVAHAKCEQKAKSLPF